jgi:hypothetical protein
MIMSNYELWALPNDKTYWEKISEFEGRYEVESRIDELLATGEYKEATVLRDHLYILGKEYKKNKVKRKKL